MTTRIAICLAGQLRTGVDALPSLLKYIGDLLPQCDFFMHTWDVESYTNPGFGSKRLDDLGIDARIIHPIDVSAVYEYAKVVKPISVTVSNYRDWEYMPFKLGGDPHLYSVRQANLLKSNYEKEYHFGYGVVLRTRPDLIYDPKKSLKDDIEQLDDNNRTFCYAQCYDYPVLFNKIDNACWLGSSYVMNQLCDFEEIRSNTHPGFEIDGFMHFGNWVHFGLGFNVKRLKNSRVAVYREFHKEQGKDPIKDFEYIFKNIDRGLPNI
jgi:hypothetical protein